MKDLFANAARRMEAMFPALFPGGTKRDHYHDFGYPAQVTFDQMRHMFMRNSVANAAVERSVDTIWATDPRFWDSPDAGDTASELEINQRLDEIAAWQAFAEADERSIVGGWSALILRIADNQPFSAPVRRIRGGAAALVQIVPAWRSEIEAIKINADQASPDYGAVEMWSYHEQAPDGRRQRTVDIHPDRLLIWSDDGTTKPRSPLEAGYNDLIDMEKIRGAGGEGFWKGARSAPVLEISPEAKIKAMAEAMGVPESEVVEAMNDQVDDFQKGFDKVLMLQGMAAKTLPITLPANPELFHNLPLTCFAASFKIPVRVLLGNQTGERASTEDAKQWARVCESARTRRVKPRLMDFARRMQSAGIMPERDWVIGWDSLLDASPSERLERAEKMTGMNRGNDEGPVFTVEEIREEAGWDASPAEYEEGS